MDEIRFEADYEFGPDFEPVVMAAVFQNPTFYDKFGPVLSSEAFSDKRWHEIALLVRDHFQKFKEVPDIRILADMIRRSPHRDPGSLITAIESLPIINGGAGYVSDRLLQWVKWRAIEQTLGDHGLRNNPREFARRIDKASRMGDELVSECTRLDQDRDGEDLRNEIMPTPWVWLNNRLNGGPERQDLVVVMTVINGGKTTVLTNVAREYAGLGMNVVYFTFEDGESKIKRRITQSISGMTTEEAISNRDLARARRDRFIEASGGMISIKQLRSRRTTVDEAIAFVRGIADSMDRPVDVVITDYADRFCPQGRYNEPRHGLREVYEDCKFMASDLDIIHWTASQINTKQMIGKEVVGIEHGSESTGKFESCDVAIGFGQGMEDQRLGRMTMFTSKMRDARKSEMVSLIADFDRQRIYEPGDDRFKRKL